MDGPPGDTGTGAGKEASEMRWKIVVVNASVVLVVGLLSYVLMLSSLRDVLHNPAARKSAVTRALNAANSRVGYDALRTQGWLAKQAKSDGIRTVFARGTVAARQEAATGQADRLRDAVSAELDAGRPPSLVVIVDAQGVVLGRNGSGLMRGERLIDIYPTLRRPLAQRESAGDVWLNRTRQEQLLVSFVPVLSDSAQVLGAIVLGFPINDDWLTYVSALTSGTPLLFGVESRGKLEIVANTGLGATRLSGIATNPQLHEAATASLRGRRTVLASREFAGHLLGIAPLVGYDSSSRAVVIAAVPLSQVESISGLLVTPLLGVTLLGLVLVLVGGVLLGNYITRPVSELEDGLLAVINGNSELRFQIEHAELGGLVFRINSLLNALMGVPEDTTDEDGRSSQVPSARDFGDALAVDESQVSMTEIDEADAQRLGQVSRSEYEETLFDAYILGKQSLGDPTDHISFGMFSARLRSIEEDMVRKHGRQVRCRLETREGTLVFVAIPVPQST